MTKIFLPDPKICIVFNGGAGGDLLVRLLTAQLVRLDNKEFVNSQGAVTNLPAADAFKDACEQFYLSNWNSEIFNKIPSTDIVNTHYAYPQLLALFPKCKFYYIDDSDQFELSTELYIKKRVLPHFSTLLNYLHKTNPFSQVKKIVNISDDQIKKIMINDWKKNIKQWNSLGISKIKFNVILDKEKCRNLIKNMLQCTINDESFSKIYDEWNIKNKNNWINN
jgi:hypothetical protein